MRPNLGQRRVASLGSEPVQMERGLEAPAQRLSSDAVERLVRRLAEFLGERPGVAPVEYTRALVLSVTLVSAAAVAIAVATVHQPADSAGLAVLAVAILAMSVSSVTTLAGGNAVRFSATAFLHLGLVLIYGPIGALVGSAAESTGAAVRFRGGWFRFLFNLANNFLSDVAAWMVFTRLQRLPVHGVVADGAFGMAAGLAQLTVNWTLLSGILAIATHRSFVSHLRAGLNITAYNLVYGYAAVGFLGLHQRYGPWGTTFALAPVAGLQVFLVFLAQRTRTHEEHRNLLLEKVTEQAATIERSYDATLIALTHALDARDKETEGHSRRVVEYTRLVAIELGIAGEELKLLCHGALLHDIGKIGVPDAILHKPGKLTEEEWQIMRRHVEMGARMVEDVDYLAEARRIILHHHERWDGRGYPLGLKSTQIALGARAFAVADAVDAMTQDRPYRRSVSFDEAREELARYRGTQFDPDAVDAFMALPQERLLSIAALRASAGLDMFSGRNFEPGSRITPRVAIVA